MFVYGRRRLAEAVYATWMGCLGQVPPIRWQVLQRRGSAVIESAADSAEMVLHQLMCHTPFFAAGVQSLPSVLVGLGPSEKSLFSGGGKPAGLDGVGRAT